MPGILPQIKHLAVVMLENRSLDNLCGCLYADGDAPALVLPAGSPAAFNGLDSSLSNPSAGSPPVPVPVVRGTSSWTVPDPDPQETFVNVTQQIYGASGFSRDPPSPMQGFVQNYSTVPGVDNVNQIMQAYLADQVPARGLAPANGTFERVRLQEWLNFISTELHKQYSPLFDPAAESTLKARQIERIGARLDSRGREAPQPASRHSRANAQGET